MDLTVVVTLSSHPWHEETLMVMITHSLLFLQEWAEPKLPNMSPAGDCCQRVVGNVWFPHRGRHRWLHPQLGWWGGPPTQALTQSTLSQLDNKRNQPAPCRHVATQNVTFSEEEIVPKNLTTQKKPVRFPSPFILQKHKTFSLLSLRRKIPGCS